MNLNVNFFCSEYIAQSFQLWHYGSLKKLQDMKNVSDPVIPGLYMQFTWKYNIYSSESHNF
jgi:hypothetical protein